MKKIICSLFFISSVTALGHGSLAQQASAAIAKSVEVFSKTQPVEVRRNFLGIAAKQTGHEQFSVVITLKNNTTQVTYECRENESVSPVVWECQ